MNRNSWLLIKIIPYPMLALIGGWMYALLEKGILGEATSYPATGNPYNFLTSIVSVSVMTILLGLILGFVEESFFKSRFRSWPFVIKLVSKTALYLTLILVLLFVSSWMTNAYNIGASPFAPAVFETLTAFFLSFTLFSILIYAGSIISACLFVAEIIDYLGIDVVSNFFNGKYNKSVNEDRVFMFLDMKGSTSIAERLGNESYYDLINQYYADMTGPIIDTKGQIYQYVGDEIVISWKLAEGLADANCVKCFFLIRNALEENTNAYIAAYGLTPEFKAGIHFGNVKRGQVGQIKKEMLFTGDALNTTARIQGLCNELQSSFLVSSSLKERLPGNDYHFEAKGSFELRGRKQKEDLFAITIPKT